jgi:hypothetical protein
MLPESLPPERLDGIAARHAAPAGPWWRQATFLVLLALGAVTTLFLVVGISSAQRNANKDCVAGDHRGPCKAAAALQQQVTSLGAIPVTTVPPPATGVRGPQGPQGVQGIEGVPGARGSRGPSGPAGPSGTRGSPGPSGQVGENGGAGDVGPTGPSGAQGEPGPSGADGPSGPAGPSGAEGSPGPTGPACPDGYTQVTVTPHPAESPGETWVVCVSTGD